MLKSKGQHLVEFTLCLAAVVAALVAMQTYVRRSLQARYRAGVQYIISGQQYEPYYTTSNFTTKYGAEAALPASWGRSVGPNEESMDSGLRVTNAVSERSGWQSLAPAEYAD